jgi:hypothetical protein
MHIDSTSFTLGMAVMNAIWIGVSIHMWRWSVEKQNEVGNEDAKGLI